MKQICILCALLLAFSTQAFSQSFTISGGHDFAAMICSEGGVKAWGGFSGTWTDISFKSLTAGSGSHIVAVSCNNIAYAWGNNEEYQCGSTSPSSITSPQPILKGETPGYDLDGNPGGDYLGNVKFVAASSSGSFALLNDGSVVGWGGNEKKEGMHLANGLKTKLPNHFILLTPMEAQ